MAQRLKVNIMTCMHKEDEQILHVKNTTYVEYKRIQSQSWERNWEEYI